MSGAVMDQPIKTSWEFVFKGLKEFGLAVTVALILIVVHIYFTSNLLTKNDKLTQQLVEQVQANSEMRKESNDVVLKALTDNTKAMTEMSMTLKSIQTRGN